MSRLYSVHAMRVMINPVKYRDPGYELGYVMIAPRHLRCLKQKVSKTDAF